MVCPHCHPHADPRQRIVLENEHCRFLQKEQDILQGSGLIVPKQHRTTAFELTPEEWAATQDLLQQARQLLDETLSPDGYNLGWNCFEPAGQTIMHAHFHIIPRFADEPHTGKGIRWWIKQPDNRRPGK
ncbi:HIT family protein [Tumebacillus avium]|uniref:HIT family protein n=1 Tax=Tumebacillus avium TaxID=1903704 RepID=A0A1Y0IP79_9BACL|nr:HIT family protein [Tumebacillus avium]ARU61636.1 HIT family protein [Tumebacillus avium]